MGLVITAYLVDERSRHLFLLIVLGIQFSYVVDDSSSSISLLQVDTFICCYDFTLVIFKYRNYLGKMYFSILFLDQQDALQSEIAELVVCILPGGNMMSLQVGFLLNACSILSCKIQ